MVGVAAVCVEEDAECEHVVAEGAGGVGVVGDGAEGLADPVGVVGVWFDVDAEVLVVAGAVPEECDGVEVGVAGGVGAEGVDVVAVCVDADGESAVACVAGVLVLGDPLFDVAEGVGHAFAGGVVSVVALEVDEDADAEVCGGALAVFALAVGVVAGAVFEDADAPPVGGALRPRHGGVRVVACAVDEDAEAACHGFAVPEVSAASVADALAHGDGAAEVEGGGRAVVADEVGVVAGEVDEESGAAGGAVGLRALGGGVGVVAGEVDESAEADVGGALAPTGVDGVGVVAGVVDEESDAVPCGAEG